ncbi:MAG: hypothetical protein IKX23_01475 [Treponema sp.]|nr:hypothetical protein [Treponema sp.]
MIVRPLFGKDSNPRSGSTLLSAVSTFVLVMLCFLGFLYSKPLIKDKKFKTVQIVLPPLEVKEEPIEIKTTAQETTQTKSGEQSASSTAVEKNETPLPKAKPAKPVKQPKVEKKEAKRLEKQKQVTAPKAVETPKLDTSAPKTYTLQKSVEEQMAEQQKTKRAPAKEFDWSSFDEKSSSAESASKVPQKKVEGSNSFSGTAGTSGGQNVSVKSDSSAGNNTQTEKASSATQSNLDAIKNARQNGNGNGADRGEQSVSAAVKTGEISLSWDGDSKGRGYNGGLSITLTDDLKKLIDRSYRISITFTVNPNGFVISSSIEMSNDALLSQAVRDKIISDISRWKFDPGEGNASATFIYNITKL